MVCNLTGTPVAAQPLYRVQHRHSADEGIWIDTTDLWRSFSSKTSLYADDP